MRQKEEITINEERFHDFKFWNTKEVRYFETYGSSQKEGILILSRVPIPPVVQQRGGKM